jgi:hypothetical protein
MLNIQKTEFRGVGKDGRPDAFKGLGAVELERYRIPQKK